MPPLTAIPGSAPATDVCCFSLITNLADCGTPLPVKSIYEVESQDELEMRTRAHSVARPFRPFLFYFFAEGQKVRHWLRPKCINV